MHIRFIDLSEQYNRLNPAIQSSLETTIQEFDFIKGNQVSPFENKFGERLEVAHCIATGNCTDALFICTGM